LGANVKLSTCSNSLAERPHRLGSYTG